MSGKPTRTTVALDPEIHEMVERIALASGERYGKVLSELVRRGLRAAETPAPRSGRRFPVFPVDRVKEPVPSAQVEEAIDGGE